MKLAHMKMICVARLVNRLKHGFMISQTKYFQKWQCECCKTEYTIEIHMKYVSQDMDPKYVLSIVLQSGLLNWKNFFNWNLAEAVVVDCFVLKE